MLTFDVLVAPVWGCVNVLLIVAAWRLACTFAPDDSPLVRIIRVAVFCWAVVVVAAIGLGITGLLTGTNLLGTVAVCSLFGIGVSWRRLPPSPNDKPHVSLNLIVLAIVVFLSLGLMVYSALSTFPTDWDSLMYHIPLIDQWLHAGSLYAPRDAVWYNPSNNELIGLWIVAPFSGDFFIDLNNLPAVILFAAGSSGLARQLRLPKPWPALICLGVIANRIFLRQITDAENDLAAAGLFVTSVCFSLRYGESGKGVELACAATAGGLLAGIKYYAFGYAFIAWVVLVLATLLMRGFVSACKAATVGLLIGFAFGGYWYIRNIAVTGSPFYPMGVLETSAPHQRFEGGVWSTTILGSGRPEVLPMLLNAIWRMAGPLNWLCVVTAPIIASWLVVASGGATHGTGSGKFVWKNRFTLVVALLGSAFVWVNIPFAVETTPGALNSIRQGYIPVRFGMCGLTIGLIAMALVLQDLASTAKTVLRARESRTATNVVRWLGVGAATLPVLVFAALAGYQLYTHFSEMGSHELAMGSILGFNFLLAASVTVIIWWLWPARRTLLGFALVATMLSTLAAATDWNSRRWHAEFASFYDAHFRTSAFTFIEENQSTNSRTCALAYRYYPFFGSRRQFTSARPNWVFTDRDFLRYLSMHRLDHVVCINFDPFPGGRYRNKWEAIRNNSSVFKVVFDRRPFLICIVDLQKVGNELNVGRLDGNR